MHYRRFPTALVVFILLTLCGTLQAALPFLETEANIVVQWGNSKALGVGPYATGGFFIHPTPSGVYEDQVGGSPVIPINAASYRHATNGAMYMVVTSDGLGNNRFFIAGMTSTGLKNTYPTPVEITKLMPCDETVCITHNATIFAVQLLDNMLAVMVETTTSPGLTKTMTMAFIGASPSMMPLGRSGSPQELKTAVTLATDPDMALVCGINYCVAKSANTQKYWGTASSAFATTPTTVSYSNTIIAGLSDAFLIASGGSIYAYGPNTNYRFGTLAGVTPMSTLITTYVTSVVDLACGTSHCVVALSDGKIGTWGSNHEGQCALPIGVNYVDVSPNPLNLNYASYGAFISVGAIGSTSYALNDQGELYAWGTNMLANFVVTSDPLENTFGDSWYGTPTYLRFSPKLTLVDIPPEVELQRAPKMPSLSNWGSEPRAVTVPARISAGNFTLLSENRIGISSRNRKITDGSQGIITWGGAYGGGPYAGIPLGNRTVSSKATYARAPTIVELPEGETWIHVAANSRAAFALTASNKIYVWGSLAQSDTLLASYVPNFEESPANLSATSPTPVLLTTDTEYNSYLYTDIASTFHSAHLIMKDPSPKFYAVYWGGELDAAYAAGTGGEFAPSANQNYRVYCGYDHCFYRDVGPGNNAAVFSASLPGVGGQYPYLGRSSDPVDGVFQVSVPNDITDLALGYRFTMMTTLTGVYACGYNTFYVLGSSDPGLNFPTLTQVPGTNTFSQIVAGYSHVLGLNSSGLFSWGTNHVGQLGRHTVMPWRPDQVMGVPSSISSLAAVRHTSFAITTHGAVYAWGLNDIQVMFGDPWTSYLGHSFEPILVNINGSLGVNFKVTSIHSSAFARTVLAIGEFITSTPVTEPMLEPQNKLFWFGTDSESNGPSLSNTFPSSSSMPASVFRSSEENTLSLRDDEFVVGSSMTWGFNTLWTNHSRVFASGVFELYPLKTDDWAQAPRSQLRYPVLVYEAPMSIVTVQNSQLGAIVLLSNGSVVQLGEFSQPFLFYGGYSALQCNLFVCALLEESTQHVQFLNSSLLPLPLTGDLTTISTDGHFAVAGDVQSQEESVPPQTFQMLASLADQLTLYTYNWQNSTLAASDVTGAFPAGVAVLKIVAGFNHFLVLGNNGVVYGFGNNSLGQLPFGTDFSTGLAPVFQSQLQGLPISNLAATTSTSYAILGNGSVYAWGYIPSEGPYLMEAMDNQDLEMEAMDLEMFRNEYGALHTYPSPILLNMPLTSGIAGETMIQYQNESAAMNSPQWAWWSGREAEVNFVTSPTQPITSNPNPASSSPTGAVEPAQLVPHTQNPPNSAPLTSPVPSPQTPQAAPSPVQSPQSTPAPPQSTPAPVVFPPTSLNLPPLEAPGPACPAPPSSGNWACDPVTGTLYLAGNFDVASGASIVVEGPLVIVGDFSLPPGSSLAIKLDSNIFGASGASGTSGSQKRFSNEADGVTPTAATNSPLVTVSGCAEINSPIVLDADSKAVKEIKKGGESGKTINIVESSCTQTPGKLLVEAGPDSQKGCRRYTVQQQETKASDGRATLSAVMVVNHDSCNHWWIILICVLAVLAVAAVIAVVILKVPKLRRSFLPYRDAKF